MNAGNPGVFSHREPDLLIVLNNFTIQLVTLTRIPSPDIKPKPNAGYKILPAYHHLKDMQNQCLSFLYYLR